MKTIVSILFIAITFNFALGQDTVRVLGPKPNSRGGEWKKIIITSTEASIIQGTDTIPLPSSTGPPGPKGDKGDSGAIGPQGIQGELGLKGDNGAPGPQGSPGNDGTPGVKGDQGLPGNDGAPGAKGDQGIQGIQGPPGNDGAAGAQGDPGISNFAIQVQALTSSPTDAQTVYFGMLPKAPTTTANISKVYIRKAGTIKIAEIYCYSGTAGTNEAWSLYVRKNNTTDYLIATLSAATSQRIFSNTTLNIAVVAGDYIEIKGIQPTWATNPLTTIYGGYIYIE